MLFPLPSNDWRINLRKNKIKHKTNATPKTAHNKRNIQERRKLWKGIKMSRPQNSRFANMKAARSYKSKFATNLLLFRFLEGTRLVCVPCQSPEGSEIKPVTKHAQLLYWKEGLCQHCRAPVILINTHALEFICKTALTPLVKSTPPLSPL